MQRYVDEIVEDVGGGYFSQASNKIIGEILFANYFKCKAKGVEDG